MNNSRNILSLSFQTSELGGKSVCKRFLFASLIEMKEKYSNELEELIFEFNNAREQRHEGLYGLDFEFSEEDCLHVIAVAESLHKKVKKMIKAI